MAGEIPPFFTAEMEEDFSSDGCAEAFAVGICIFAAYAVGISEWVYKLSSPCQYVVNPFSFILCNKSCIFSSFFPFLRIFML